MPCSGRSALYGVNLDLKKIQKMKHQVPVHQFYLGEIFNNFEV